MDKFYNKSIRSIKQKLMNDLDTINKLSEDRPDWTKPLPITEPSQKSKGFPISNKKSIGVYRIIHKPTNKVVSIGCGRVSSRKYRHKAVHGNKGKTLISKNGAPSPSMTGMHMYRYDKNINNYLFQWTHIGNKPLAEQYEKYLQHEEKPLFNNLSMAGK